MALTLVKMCEEVYLTCLTHALSTESEEIMGLLLGDIYPSENGGVTALIWGASPQPRCDRRKDRVETNPEQLTAATAQADHKMTIATGRTTRVIGWYHSHPHITVLPSHVDVRTQAMYQLLDSGFIGLIFSCFSEDKHKVGRIQVIAFQSSDGKQSQIVTAVPLSPVDRGAITDLDLSASISKNASAPSGTPRSDFLEQDTADSGAIILHPKVGGESPDVGGFIASSDMDILGDNHGFGDNTMVDIDSMDMSDSMQEALFRSNLEMSGSEFTRKEIPLHVLPALSLLELDSPLTSFVDLQRVLFEEEQAAYNQAISQSTSKDGKIHPLTLIHHQSTYRASLCKLMEYCLSPAINALQGRLRENELRLSALADEAKLLESATSQNSNMSSPQNSPHGGRASPVFGHTDLYNPLNSTNTRSHATPGSQSRKVS